ncbi:MAG: nucleotide exchange factor GrpE [Candidatus Zixiibacteriota bacterium]
MTEKKRGKTKATSSQVEERESTPQKAISDLEPSEHEPREDSQAIGSVEAEPGSEQKKMSDSAEAEATPAKTTEEEKLSEEDQLKKQLAELEDKLLRTAAEFENYKKRMARQFEDIVRTANDKILVDLLEVVDNFERALKHSDNRANNTDVESLRKGMELTFNQMTDLLNKYNVVPIESVGKPFDPNLHEALMQVESDEYPEGIVAVEMSKGYKQGDRVLRHSKVAVSKGKPEEEQQDDDKQTRQ